MRASARRLAALPLVGFLALALALSTVAPVLGAERAVVVQTRLSPWTGAINLYRSDAWVRQYTSTWCTAAAVQMMVNLVTGSSDRSYDRQLSIIRYEQAHDSLRRSTGSDPEGWAAALRYFGAGSTYGWATYGTMTNALSAAAERMRLTNRPVGLLVWSGRHAWVMHGFRATADPAGPAPFSVTDVYVSGPLAGSDPRNARLSTSALAGSFNRYQERDGYAAWINRWVIVQP
jgi:hypothetical protein